MPEFPRRLTEGDGADGEEWGPVFELSAAEHLGVQVSQQTLQRARAEADQVLLSVLLAHGGDQTCALHYVDQAKRTARFRRKVAGPAPVAPYAPSRKDARALARKLRR
jgi:hypothetical protein